MLYLNCPRCGLTILPRVDWLTVEHCPRCIARRRTRVPMLSATAPSAVGPAAGPLASAAAGSPPGASAA
jgi:uncharacterized paraquat-inducible protein A